MKSFNCGQISRACNPGHNILEHYNILVQIRFTTNKRKLDIQYSKRGIRIASRVAERLKTQKNMKFGWTPSLVPSLPSITQTLRIAVKKHSKAETKLFFFCSVLLYYSSLFQIFCPGLSEQANFSSLLDPFPFQLQFFDIFITPKYFCELQ